MIRWSQETGIEVKLDKTLSPIKFDDLETWISNEIPKLEIDPYDYQLKTFIRCIRNNRALVLSPTGSGKSFIIYMIIRYLLDQIQGKVLISVPSTNLVRQMHIDFCDYEEDRVVCDTCYEMAANRPKETNKRVVIATWSMLLRRDKEFFDQFDVFICDEAHQADSQALTKIINHMTSTPFRFGFTGTLDGSKSHEMQCRAWFGSLVRSKSTRELIDAGILSPLQVKCISLEYPDVDRKAVKSFDYSKEIAYIIAHSKRNEWLVHLALSQEKNTMLLFNLVEKHGLSLFDLAKKKAPEYGKQVHLIIGDVGVDERESIRQIMEHNDNVVVFASFGTMSVGVNIKNLHNLILAHPFKARIRTLQSIGRTLRKLEKLTSDKIASIIDIIDNFCIGKHQNTTYKHGIQRLRIYEAESFETSYETQQL